MTSKKLILGGPLFDGVSLSPRGTILIEDRKIAAVYPDTIHMINTKVIDVQGRLIMPGLVDLHSDSLERSIEKRKGVFFDIDFAVLNLDRQAAACGITTFCHAVSFDDNELGLRSPEEAEHCVRAIKAFNDSPQALVKHRVHIRYEVGSERSFHIVTRLVEEGLVDLFSIMDHTPGQGQFKSMAAYVRYLTCEHQVPEHQIIEKARQKQASNARDWELVSTLAHTVGSAGIPMLSHDDDTLEKIDLIRALGIGACEFPITLEAARKAGDAGMHIFMGAPNLVRDQSTSGSLKASDVLRQDLCTGLVSDYYPESLLQAALMGKKHTGSPASALRQVTAGPGDYLCAPARPGRLTRGADADIIIVDQSHTWAHITHSLVKGRTVFNTQLHEAVA
ncbi:alpha-D-ribose 1-methylphosphonate 5-triphosphate diphosphatase [Desulfotignum balticum]|uniref:alpha-D-ribose 1-methylphosphonate 5-triphosphate diphosphatase n=1 Tax=Desulfotignum balticum TaxID=115781 RepID=UPI0003FAF2F5|nr:alpha-D-ribose 1-methylphosphonate 5-triphosphate diphosphatase [Desulfotignum balticum]